MPAVILDWKGANHAPLPLWHRHPPRPRRRDRRARGASHGAANFLERVLLPILQDHAPINIIAVADGGNDLRRAVFPTYKQKRKERKEDEARPRKSPDRPVLGAGRACWSTWAAPPSR